MTSPTVVPIHATTVVCVRHRGRVAVAGDGQVSVGQTIMKSKAKKVRRLHQDRVLAGFAGSTADALTLFVLIAPLTPQCSGTTCHPHEARSPISTQDSPNPNAVRKFGAHVVKQL